MVSIFLIFLIFLFAAQHKTLYLAILFLPSLFFYFFAFEVRKSNFVSSFFEHDVIHDYQLYIVIGCCLTISALIGLSKIPQKISLRKSFKILRKSRIVQLKAKNLVIAYYFLSILSIVAFIVNFERVDFDVSLLFIAPRLYEELFGHYTLVNYLYFLNVPALCLFIYVKNVFKISIKYSLLLNITLILISFFHGIKFTVFDTFLIPAFFSFHSTSDSKVKTYRILFVLTLLLFFYLLFSYFIRGAGNIDNSSIETILNYILPNYYNFAYSLENVPFQFNPISPFLPDKVYNPFQDIVYNGMYGFTLNDRFNMATAFPVYYGIMPLFSSIFAFPLIIYIRNLYVNRKSYAPSLTNFFILTYIDYCVFFSWYFFAFNKSKYLYYILIFYLLEIIISRFRVKYN